MFQYIFREHQIKQERTENVFVVFQLICGLDEIKKKEKTFDITLQACLDSIPQQLSDVLKLAPYQFPK
jgi:hypothetical protein